MKLSRTWAWVGACLLPIGLAAFSCGKAKSALEAAAGASLLEDSDIAAIKTKVQWSDTDPMYKNMEIVKGIKLLDNFQGDLSQKVKIPVGVDIPNQVKDAAGNQKSILLTKVIDMAVDAKTTYSRLQIVTVARFDPDTKELVIDGDVVNQKLDANQVVSKANKNQAGTYLLIQGKGNAGFAFLTGTISLKRDGQTDAQAEATKNAWVFTTSSPFVTQTGDKGTYFLTMLQGSKGSVVAFKSNIQTVGSENPTGAAAGTPVSASKDVSYSGVLDKYKGAFDSKISGLGASQQTQANTFFDTVNTKVTDFLNGWKIVQSDMMFIQPKQTPPAAPAAPPAAQPKPSTAPAKVTPPSDVLRADSTTPATYNVDLGCKGFNAAGKAIDMVYDGAYYDDYTNYPGWRAHGDVHYSAENASVLFELPATGDTTRYLDGAPTGYCVLTTADSMYQEAGATDDNADFQPRDGLTSEMWQKVQVPATAKSVMFRVAFLSTEFPKFVGTQYNDSFFIKFDESPNVLASGNLNDLAGVNSSTTTDAEKTAISNCNTYTYSANAGSKCGDWEFVADFKSPTNKTMTGAMWGIADATNTPSNGDTMGCGDTKCWSGMIPPRIICKDLDAGDVGATRTLRFAVSNAGDTFFPSALAVDSVVFSTSACAAATPLTPEPKSRASQL